uniref:Protein disulfide isomerase n=1 Tax=Phakopsora pachyrhizi TaxID=170000 RepID=A0A0S1MJ51_PHAPC
MSPGWRRRLNGYRNWPRRVLQWLLTSLRSCKSSRTFSRHSILPRKRSRAELKLQRRRLRELQENCSLLTNIFFFFLEFFFFFYKQIKNKNH